MRSFLPAATALGALFILTSCQSLSKEECQVADWQVIGQNDGAAGYSPQDRFAQHVKACSRIGIAPDQTLWRQGFEVGLTRYCTPLNGLTVGRNGRSYANVCPPETSEGFLRGYNLGRSAYTKQRDIDSRQSRISASQAEIARLEDQARTEDKREVLGSIFRQIGDLRARIRDNEREIDRLRYELAQVNRDIDWFSANPEQSVPLRNY